jgi:hypothetical protein
MLTFLTILIMLAVGYAEFREGIFTAFTMLVNVILAGLIAFNFWEPLASLTDSGLKESFLDGYQDLFFLILLFSVALGILRTATNNLANRQIAFPAVLQQFGAAGVGMLTGYLVSGFLVCALETLPWHQNFLDFEPQRNRTVEGDFRRYLPADRVWLSLMHFAGANGFARAADNESAQSPYERYPTFDRSGSFELRYWRYRRYSDKEGPLPYQGELDQELRGHP